MTLIRRLCGPFFVLAGAMHFLKPSFYLAIMPDWLPWHSELVAASGVAEIAGGLALMAPNPEVRRAGGWFTIATLIAVFPANVDMALNPDNHPHVPGGAAALYARLPVQAIFIAWVLSAMRERP